VVSTQKATRVAALQKARRKVAALTAARVKKKTVTKNTHTLETPARGSIKQKRGTEKQVRFTHGACGLIINVLRPPFV